MFPHCCGLAQRSLSVSNPHNSFLSVDEAVNQLRWADLSSSTDTSCYQVTGRVLQGVTPEHTLQPGQGWQLAFERNAPCGGVCGGSAAPCLHQPGSSSQGPASTHMNSIHTKLAQARLRGNKNAYGLIWLHTKSISRSDRAAVMHSSILQLL